MRKGKWRHEYENAYARGENKNCNLRAELYCIALCGCAEVDDGMEAENELRTALHRWPSTPLPR